MTEIGISLRCRAIAAVVLRRRGATVEVLLLRRAKGSLAGLWSLVTGRLEVGETGWQAALREVTEETGLQPLQLYSADFCDQFYDPENEVIEVVPMFVTVVADGAAVSIDAAHSEHRWAAVLEASELVPFLGHRLALREIHRDFVVNAPAAWRLIRDCEAG